MMDTVYLEVEPIFTYFKTNQGVFGFDCRNNMILLAATPERFKAVIEQRFMLRPGVRCDIVDGEIRYRAAIMYSISNATEVAVPEYLNEVFIHLTLTCIS